MSRARTRAGDSEQSPSPSEIRETRESASLSVEAAASMIYASRRAWVEWEVGRFPMHRAFFELFKIKAKEQAAPVRLCPICGNPIPYSPNAMKACSAKCRSERKRRLARDLHHKANHATEEGAKNDDAEGA